MTYLIFVACWLLSGAVVVVSLGRINPSENDDYRSEDDDLT